MRGKVSTRICVRVLWQLFCSIPQNKTVTPPPDVQRRKRFYREIKHIYVCMRSMRRNPIRSPRELLVQLQYRQITTIIPNAKIETNVGGGAFTMGVEVDEIFN